MANPTYLLKDATATGTGTATDIRLSGGAAAFQAKLSGASGAISATAALYGSNDPLALVTPSSASGALLATIALSGTGAGADISVDNGVAGISAQYSYYWAAITAIAGTGATVSVFVGA